MTTPKTPAQEEVHAHEAGSDIRFVSLLTAAGFGCFWACVIAVVACLIFTAPLASMFEVFALRFLFLLGFAGIHWISYSRVIDAFSESSFKRAIRIFIGAACLIFFAGGICSAFGVMLPFFIEAPLWLLFGIACGLLLVEWGTAWTMLDAERPDNHGSALTVAGSIIAAAVLATFFLFAPSVTAVVACGFLYVASLALQVYCSKQMLPLEQVDAKTSRIRLDLLSRNLLTPLIVGLVLGMTLAICMLLLDARANDEFLLIGVAGAGIAAFCTLLALKRVPRISSIERIIFPIVGGCLLLVPYLEGLSLAFVLWVLVIALIAYLVFHWNVLIALSYRHHVQTPFHYAQGLIAPLGSVAVGWAIVGIFGFGLDMPFGQLALIVSLGAVFLLLLELAIVPFASNKVAESISGELEETEAVPKDKNGSWRRRCQAVCERYQLTPREVEVFVLLAKGRNTEHIANSLVISTHTVKTHASRIYRKLSINSQQELIDIVEASEA